MKFVVTLRDVFSVVEALVDIHGVIDHVSFAQELDFGLEDLILWV